MKEQIKTTQEIIDHKQIESDLVKANLQIQIQVLLNDMERIRHLNTIRDRKLNDLNAPHA
jgi:hypothetical protein